MNKSDSISALAARKISQDKKNLTRINNQNKRKYGKELFGNEKAGLYDELTESYLEKFGLDEFNILEDDAGKYVFMSKSDFKKKIRAYLKDTEGFIDTKLLDDILGTNPFTEQDWVDAFINRLRFTDQDEILRFDFYVEELLNSLGAIKNNASIKGSTYYDQIYMLINQMGVAKKINKHEWVMFEDFIGSVTNNIIGSGHSDNYYRKGIPLLRGITHKNTTEAIANYTSLMGSNNAELFRKLLEELIPETMKAFDDIFELLNQI